MDPRGAGDIWVGDNWVLQKQFLGDSEAPGYCKYLEEFAQQPYYRPIRLECKGKAWVGKTHAEHKDIRVKCSWLDCNCYPFVCFVCKICNEQWWTHCRKGRAPRSVCKQCWRAQRKITEETLNWKVANQGLEAGTPAWWEIFTKGINPELHCYHSNEPLGPFLTDITIVKCRKRLKKLRCDIPQLKDRNWSTRRSKWARENSSPEEYPCCHEDGLPCSL